jgi:IS5 family transposase
VLRTVGDQPGLWESILPRALLVLPEQLARVDELLDDPAFFAPLCRFRSAGGASIHSNGDLSAG